MNIASCMHGLNTFKRIAIELEPRCYGELLPVLFREVALGKGKKNVHLFGDATAGPLPSMLASNIDCL